MSEFYSMWNYISVVKKIPVRLELIMENNKKRKVESEGLKYSDQGRSHCNDDTWTEWKGKSIPWYTTSAHSLWNLCNINTCLFDFSELCHHCRVWISAIQGHWGTTKARGCAWTVPTSAGLSWASGMAFQNASPMAWKEMDLKELYHKEKGGKEGRRDAEKKRSRWGSESPGT